MGLEGTKDGSMLMERLGDRFDGSGFVLVPVPIPVRVPDSVHESRRKHGRVMR